MKRLLIRALLKLGTARRLRKRNQHKLPVLMYHGIVPTALTPFCWHQLDVASFERQMAFVAQHYNVLPLEEALAHVAAGTLPPRSLCITFDDGYHNNIALALPILERHGMHATIFVATDYVGSDDVLWPDRLYLAVRAARIAAWDAASLGLGSLPLGSAAQKADALAQVYRAMKSTPVDQWAKIQETLLRRLGVDGGAPDDDFRAMTWADLAKTATGEHLSFAAHTRTHPILSQASDEVVTEQITTSHCTVIEHTLRAPTVFAYPNGRTQDFDQRAKDVLTSLAVPFALTTELGLIDNTHPPHELPRICVGADLSFERFQLLLAGR